MSKKIQLIIGSTRQNRIGPQVAEWVQAQAAKHADIDLEVIDLKDRNLPFFEAPIPPSIQPDQTAHGQAWAAKIGQADGYIFVTAEYNRGVPAPLKNAIDYLLAEWKHKPAMVVSYGFLDGGTKANAHLHDTMEWLKMPAADAAAPIAVHLLQDFVIDGVIQEPQRSLAKYEPALQSALAQLAAYSA